MNEPYQIVQTMGNNQLVEFVDDGLTHRVWLPRGEEVSLTNLQRGIEIGPTLEDLETLGLVIDARVLLEGLHRRGIWTKEDLRRGRGIQSVQAALFEGLGWALTQLLEAFEQRRI